MFPLAMTGADLRGGGGGGVGGLNSPFTLKIYRLSMYFNEQTHNCIYLLSSEL